jgi:hypothetical protein
MALGSLYNGSLLTKNKSHDQIPFCVNMYRRVSTTFLLAQTLRACCYLATTLPGSASHCQVPRGSAESLASLAALAWGRRGRDVLLTNCGDSIFSGHLTLTLSVLMAAHKYTPGVWQVSVVTRRWVVLALAAAIVAQACFIVAFRNHYTVDVVLALYVVPTMWVSLEVMSGTEDLSPDAKAVASCKAFWRRRADSYPAFSRIPPYLTAAMVWVFAGACTVVLPAVLLTAATGLLWPTHQKIPNHEVSIPMAARASKLRQNSFYLHQTYKHCDASRFPAAWRDTPKAWRKAFPEARYRCWSDKALLRLIAKVTPELLPVYEAMPQHIMRVDAARYVLLQVYGGLYADLDLLPTPELVKIVRLALGNSPRDLSSSELGTSPDVVLFSSKLYTWWQPPSFQITNSLMLACNPSRAKDFYAHVANGLSQSLASTWQFAPFFGNYYYVLTATGSRFLNLRYLAYQGGANVQVLPVRTSRRVIVSLPGSTWHADHPFATFMRNIVHPLLRWDAWGTG